MMAPTFIGFCALLLASLILVDGGTHAPDVSALTVMYSSLNSPSKLTGWSSSKGDPCGDNWKGITCSGSSVTEIDLSGLGLTGSMGYQLSSLTSVTHFDLSKNNLQGDIPYQLPPNAVHINLASNSFTGGVPYSISQMSDLKYLNLGHNHLGGQLSDMFGKLSKLSSLDLSFNTLSGNLPQSFGSLSNLQTMYLQHNKFTGPINVLARLPLEDLNVANNHFTGWIPNKLMDIYNIETEGNSWSSGPAPPGSQQANKLDGQIGGKASKSALRGGAIAVVVVSVLILVVVLLVIFARKSSKSLSSHFLEEEKINQSRPFTPLASHEFKDLDFMEQPASLDIRSLQTSASLGLKQPSLQNSSSKNSDFSSKFNANKSTNPVAATTYSLVDLQEATANFGTSRLIGEGSMGRAYKAKFSDGKVLAVKKIDPHSSVDFSGVISDISRLHHPNIAELVGYCSECGHHLLVFEFMRNGSLHDFLHLSDDYSKPLTWNTRIKIALGTARALEYLHDGCSPSVVHRNIKSSNILLDVELKPYLSDCGLATFYQHSAKNEGDGYNAPEFTNSMTYTLQSDVYSFGVVMLELLTGRMPFDSSKAKIEQSLVRWATPQLHDIDALDKMVDPALRGLYPPKSLSRFADVIALCVQLEPEFRPDMSEVVQSLVQCERG